MEKEKLEVYGIAIRPGLSRNGIRYSKKELEKFAPTLKNKPILKDHNTIVDNTVGLITKSGFNDGIVTYEGWVKDDNNGLIERIKDGRAKEVSIGAMVGKLLYDEKKEEMIAEQLEAMELSITPTPGVKGTSLNQVLGDMKKRKAGEKIKIMPIVESFSMNNDEEDVSEHESVKKEQINEVNNMVDNQIDKNKIKEEVRAEIEAEKREKEALKAELKEEIKEEIRKEIMEELKSEEEEEGEAEEEEEEEMNDEEETEEKVKAKLKEEIKAELKEEMRPKTKGKVKMEKDENNIEEDVPEYQMENAEFGEGYALWKMPKADGSY